ncbi:MAG TPA: sodium:proton antiporter [Thermoanaerobaculia bacterium]|nr:sodium:proton antiporter [Thermoanaerobaculia bacterium]
MSFDLWFLLLGGLLIAIALVASWLRHFPLTTTILYLLVGFALGPFGAGAIRIDPLREAGLLERLTELAVIISLFTAGLKFRLPLRDRLWRLPVRLAFGSMGVTVGLIALIGTFGLGLPLGAAILLGAVLAPTDPVLASEVQLAHPGDRNRLRFSLTGEAGLNDGTAFPFVMLGLGLLGAHEIGAWGWRWLAIDVVWAIVAGLAIGFALGTLIGRIVLFLRKEHKEAFGLDDFLALGLIGLSYGAALLLHSYGFLAVFAAGLALRRIERLATPGDDEEPPDVREMAAAGSVEEIATDPEKAPSYMAQAVLGFNEQVERIFEVGVVLLVGGMLSSRYLPPDALWFIPLLFLGVRPVAVVAGLAGTRLARREKGMIAWFGIRGIGSIYYLMYAIEHGLPADLAERLTGLTLTAVAASILVHGISVTPLMKLHEKREEGSPVAPRYNARA